MMEFQKAKNTNYSLLSQDDVHMQPDEANKGNKACTMKNVIMSTAKGLIFNPLIFTMVLGVSGNFLLGQHIPHMLQNLLNALSGSFGATALFYLGFSLGTNSLKVNGLALVLPVLLVALKGILLPIVMREIVVNLVHGSDHSLPSNRSSTGNHTQDLSTFAFFYGTIPTAPTVIIYASKYGISEDIVATGLVMGTVVSAPVLLSSVKMLQVRNIQDIDVFKKLIADVAKDVSIISLVLCVWVVIVFVSLGLHKRMIHRCVFVLVGLQIIHGAMGATHHIFSHSKSAKLIKFCVWLNIFSLNAMSCCAAILAVVLAMSLCSNAHTVRRYWLFILLFGMILPSVIATWSLLTLNNIVGMVQNSMYFSLTYCFTDKITGILSITTNTISVVLIFMALFKLSRKELFSSKPTLYAQKDEKEPKQPLLSPSTENCESCVLQSEGMCDGDMKTRGNAVADIENLDADVCLVKQSNDAFNTTSADKNIEFVNSISDIEKIQLTWLRVKNENHVTQHVVLILILLFLIILNISLMAWYMLPGTHNEGIFLELEMLSVVLTYGQGFFTFFVFGFLKELSTLPVFEWLFLIFSRHLNKKVILPEISNVDSDVLLLCERFRKHHMDNCAKDIISNLKFRFKTYENVFKGSCLVTWLVESGLVNDRYEAVKYGNHLLEGRVIEHCTNRYYFHDLPYIYQFKKNVEKVVSKNKKRKKRFTK
ncbi:integral membrane protein GPR155-like isoform X2 [Hydractinia symbiolongicarpus]|nr:integral membrane protein GPR155-like isoform X2 [Hydractinia symbiolongicarpus]XP_057308544.1 integral membrane protein GPR155-like isoform X2 [Hydractinia symbiolongicarpus]